MAYLKLAKRFDISAFAYAHRGLWTKDGPSENSLEAYLAAAANGLGIEFDIRPSADGTPMLFHDPELDRMTQAQGLFEARGDADLHRINLNGGEAITPFAALLEQWPKTTPLLCELKVDGRTAPEDFAKIVGEMLEHHDGPAAAMSFSKRAVSALPPSIMRGQLIYPKLVSGGARFERDLDHAQTHQGIDYIACHWSDAEALQSLRDSRTRPLITWTVRDPEQCKRLTPLVDAQIFEGFDLALAKSTTTHTS
jgi:glycerophosphoryl diester phosphodiesterase